MLDKIEKYKIISKIGSGGTSDVYLGKNIESSQKVAIKILDRRLSLDEEYLSRFKKEASISKELDHPNIVKLLSFGNVQDSYYIIYEYIEGITLDKHIKNKKLNDFEVEIIAIQILKALEHAHNNNVIHRDIKPSNIMISEGNIKVLDFGIAKQSESATVTKTGLFLGTPHYVSPEQIEGGGIDKRTDIYSFGILLYEMVTGTLPFISDTPWGIIRAHLDKEPLINEDMPSKFSYIISKCLKKDKNDRFFNAEEALQAFKEENPKDTMIIQWDEKETTVKNTDAFSNTKNNEDKSNNIKERKKIPANLLAAGIIAILVVGGMVSIIVAGMKADRETQVASAETTTTTAVVVETTEVIKPQIIEIEASELAVGPEEHTTIFIDYTGSNITTYWSASDGVVKKIHNSRASWKAPNKSGNYWITAKIVDENGLEDYKIIKVSVSENDSKTSTYTTKKETQGIDYSTANAEVAFLNKINSLLDEYGLAFNHVDTYFN